MDIDEGKEILTTAIIKREVINRHISSCAIMLIVWPLLTVILLMIATFFQHASFYSLLNKIFLWVCLLGFLGDTINAIRFYYKIKTEQFTIEKSVLYKKEDWKGPQRPYTYVPPKLFFDRNRYYALSKITYYKWSHSYCMGIRELFETSRIDDHFTLVILNKKIVLVYNNKFFDTSCLQYSN